MSSKDNQKKTKTNLATQFQAFDAIYKKKIICLIIICRVRGSKHVLFSCRISTAAAMIGFRFGYFECLEVFG